MRAQVHVLPLRQSPYVNNNVQCYACGRLKVSRMIVERTPSSYLYRYNSLGSSMVWTSHQSSEGCGFDPRLGLRNSFCKV